MSKQAYDLGSYFEIRGPHKRNLLCKMRDDIIMSKNFRPMSDTYVSESFSEFSITVLANFME